MIRLLKTISTTPSVFFCILALSTLAAAQFETRSTTKLAHEPCGIAAADFRNNGTQDFAVALNSTEIQVALGNGDGTFQKPAPYSAGDGVNWLATGALTSSGNVDIAVANRLSNFVSVLLGNGDGTFQPARSVHTPASPSFIAIGDFNGDQIPDLLVSDSPYITLLPGNGDGTFGHPISTKLTYTPGGFAVGDFDKNGTLDLAVEAYTDGTNALVILLGNGDGTFRQKGNYQFSAPVGLPVVADFRGNGEVDLALAEGGQVQVLLGNGDGTFEAPVGYNASSFVEAVVTGDFNGDGKVDLAAVGTMPSGVSLLLGQGDGTFGASTFFPAAKLACYAAVADFNGDQQPDLAVTDNDLESVVTLLNTGQASFSPITPIAFPDQLVGTSSPPLAVTFLNAGASELTISSITASQPYRVNSTCGKSVSPGANCVINVTFWPTSQGTKTGTISIVDSASSKPQVIELSGSGTVVTLSPSSLNFGSQRKHSTSPPQQIKLTNTGAIALNITKMTLHGLDPYDFSETSNCPSSLGAGASCTVTVTFSPLILGPRSAILYVTDSGGGTPQTVLLSGTGIM